MLVLFELGLEVGQVDSWSWVCWHCYSSVSFVSNLLASCSPRDLNSHDKDPRASTSSVDFVDRMEVVQVDTLVLAFVACFGTNSSLKHQVEVDCLGMESVDQVGTSGMLDTSDSQGSHSLVLVEGDSS